MRGKHVLKEIFHARMEEIGTNGVTGLTNL
jgi:hypothetical protein